MGACSSGNSSSLSSTLSTEEATAQANANKKIEKSMKNDAKDTNNPYKLLLLGTGGTGKSTLLKNLKKSRGTNIVDVPTAKHTKQAVRRNLVHSMMTLLEKSAQLYRADAKRNRNCMVDIQNTQITAWIKLRMCICVGRRPTCIYVYVYVYAYVNACLRTRNGHYKVYVQ